MIIQIIGIIGICPDKLLVEAFWYVPGTNVGKFCSKCTFSFSDLNFYMIYQRQSGNNVGKKGQDLGVPTNQLVSGLFRCFQKW